MFNDKRRGDIWWAQDTTHKREGTRLIRGDRPVVIVSSDEVNCNTRIVTVVPPDLQPGAAGPRRRHLRSGSSDRLRRAKYGHDPAGARSGH